MSNIELKEKLITRIQNTENNALLEEVYRMLGLESDDVEVYKLSEQQRNVVAEARDQIKKGKTIPNAQADKEIDEWLSE